MLISAGFGIVVLMGGFLLVKRLTSSPARANGATKSSPAEKKADAKDGDWDDWNDESAANGDVESQVVAPRLSLEQLAWSSSFAGKASLVQMGSGRCLPGDDDRMGRKQLPMQAAHAAHSIRSPATHRLSLVLASLLCSGAQGLAHGFA